MATLGFFSVSAAIMKIPAFRLERFFAEHEFTAAYNLCASDCESTTIAELLALEPDAEQAFLDLPLGYTESAGSPSLCAEIAKNYANIDPAQVLVHAGGQEAIFTYMNAVLKPGDHVVVHHPCYQSLHEVPRAIGCDVDYWSAHPDDRWRLDLDELRALILDHTRLVIINQPHSPTGQLMSREGWQALIDLLRERGIKLFSDEAYRGLEYRPEDRLPPASDIYEGAFSLSLLSKGYGLPGLRIGWLTGRDAETLNRVANYKDYTTICSSAPSEFLAELVLRSGGHLLERNRELCHEHVSLLNEFFLVYSEYFDWVPPQAGSVTFPTLRGEEGVEAFCARALQEAGVLLLPGTLFAPESREFRIGFGRKNFSEGLNRLSSIL